MKQAIRLLVLIALPGLAFAAEKKSSAVHVNPVSTRHSAQSSNAASSHDRHHRRHRSSVDKKKGRKHHRPNTKK